MTITDVVAFLVTVVSIWLATRENVWYYPTGIVSVLLYVYIYANARLYAEAGLQFVWLGLMIYGWYHWLRGGKDRTELPVTRTPSDGWIAAALSGVAMTALIAWLQRRYTDNPAPFVDSSIAAWSIVAQWMTAKKWLENWLLWTAINVVAIGLYLDRRLWLLAAQYLVIMILGIRGWFTWRKSLASA